MLVPFNSTGEMTMRIEEPLPTLAQCEKRIVRLARNYMFTLLPAMKARLEQDLRDAVMMYDFVSQNLVHKNYSVPEVTPVRPIRTAQEKFTKDMLSVIPGGLLTNSPVPKSLSAPWLLLVKSDSRNAAPDAVRDSL
jgi:hypothetical protein